MIGYVTVGTNDLTKATAFYDALLAPLSGTRMFQTDTLSGYGFGPGIPHFSVTTPFDKASACVGNGTMIAFDAKTPEAVDQVHALALSLGATNEGACGPRGKTFYCGYLRDLDGNKLNIYCQT